MKRLVLALAALALSSSAANAQTTAPAAHPPSAAEVLQHWRDAMRTNTDAPAHARYSYDDHGVARTLDTWVSPDASLFRRRIASQYDSEEWLLTPERAEMRDWNGFVRVIDGTELARLRGDALHAATLAFGPQAGAAGEVAANTIDQYGGWNLRVTTPERTTEWLFDQGWTPRMAISTDAYGERTVETYSWWSAGMRTDQPNRHMPLALIVGEGEDAVPYRRGDGDYVRHPREVFAPLTPGPSDVVIYRNSVRLPFSMEANHIVVQTRVNGHAPIGFLIDTGAAQTNLNSARMAGFGVSFYGGGQVEGGGGSTQNVSVESVTLALEGGVALRRQHAKAIDMSGLERAWGVPVGGILGYDFLSRFVVEVDYQNRVMTLHRPQAWRYRGHGAVVPLTFDGGTPYAEARISVPGKPDLPARLLIDNGLADTMVFTRPYVEANDLARLASHNAAVNPTAGLDNQFFAQRNTRGRIDELRLGDLAMRDIPVNFSTNTSGAYASSFFAATIGNTVFSRYNMILDYEGRQLIFEPTPAADVPFAERRTFGLTLLAGGNDLRTFTVSGLRAASPAAAAGFLQNDVIAGVDERDAASFTLQELRDLLLRDGEHHDFRVRRGDETLTIAADVALVSIER